MNILLNETIRLSQVIKEFKESSDSEVVVTIEPHSIFASNKINLSLLTRLGQRFGKLVRTNTDLNAPVGSVPAVPVRLERDLVSEPAKAEPESTEAEKAKTGQVKKQFSLKPRKLLLGVIGMAFVGSMAAAAFAWYYLPQGTVTLYVAEKDVERTATVTVDPQAVSVDLVGKIVPGRTVTVSKEDVAKTTATGKKVVGEKASGEVELRNFKVAAVGLGAGTQLTLTSATETLLFTLASGVTVPAAQTSGDTRVAGKIKATGNATQIGENYNIASGLTLSVADYTNDEVYAVSTAAFTGGSQREVTVVATIDQDNAKEQITAKVKTELIAKLKEEIGDSETFDVETVAFTTRSLTYSHDIDQEIAEFTTTISMQAQVVAVKNDDVAILLREDLLANLPDGFELSTGTEAVTIQETVVNDGNYSVKARVSALVTPKLPIDEIKVQLIGKGFDMAENYLRAVDKVEGYDIKVRPMLPRLIATIPHIADRLVVEVKIAQ